MDSTDPTDPTEIHRPVDGTELVEQPPPTSPSRTRILLVGAVTALALGVVAVGVVLARDAAVPAGDQSPTVAVETGTSTAGSVAEAVAPTSSSVTPTSDAVAAPVTTLPPAPPPAGQPVQQPANEPAPQPQDPATGAPTIPAGHVDSCAYPDMGTTVVSGTTYTAAPTPTVTAVTSPDRCPPYSAGPPWDGS